MNRRLEASANPVEFSDRPFELHPIVRELIPTFILKMPEAELSTTDDAKVRLGTDLTVDLLERRGKVHLQRTSYFRDRLSNTLSNYRVRLEGREIVNLRGETLDAEGHLVGLKESQLSNQLGASTLLVTADSTIVYLRQGSHVAENRGRLAPAGSGSFDLPRRRMREGRSLQELAREEAGRELCEECGLRREDLYAIHLCGFGRFLYRSGKPELFCIATTRREAHAIEVPVREWDFQQRKVEYHAFDGVVSARNVLRGLDGLRARLEGGQPGFEHVSGPLYWAVMFAKEHLERLSPVAEEALFGGLREAVAGLGR